LLAGLLLAACFSIRLPAQQTVPADPVGSAQTPDLTPARKAIETNDFQAAESLLKLFLSNHPGSADARYLYAYALLRLNQPQSSLAEYTRAATLRTPTSEDLTNVAQDYVLLQDLADADKWAARAVAMNAKDPDAWYALGRIRYSQNRLKDALACFQQVLALAPHSAKAENNLGLVYEGLNQTPDAILAYRQALQWQQDAPHPSEQPMINLATVLIQQGQLDEALSLLNQALAIAPQDVRIHEQLGHLHLQKGQLPEAQREFESAVKLLPSSAADHFLLGQVYHRLGLEPQAKSELSRAAELNGTHSTQSPQ
jgi:tetratricopeptide (TPR) repeat protein